VVASKGAGARCEGSSRVSIPFIAGQWSLLLTSLRPAPRRRCACLNPLHCGAVVASIAPRRMAEGQGGVSIPFIAGQWSLLCRLVGVGGERRLVSIPFIAGQWSLRGDARRGGARVDVSIPFIAGQWSLRAKKEIEARKAEASQSPSLRGSGRFALSWEARTSVAKSQSPSLRGSGRFSLSRPWRRSSPPRLNPLHCGAVVASTLKETTPRTGA